MERSQLFEGAKLESRRGTKIEIDKITDKGIYTSGRNLTLKNHDRLFRNNSEVSELLTNGGWKYINTKKTITIPEIYAKFPEWKGMPIEGFGELKDDSRILSGDLKKGEVLYAKNMPTLTRTVKGVNKDSYKMTMLTMEGVNLDMTTVFDVDFQSAYEILSLNKNKSVSKATIAEALGLSNPNLLTIVEK